MSARRSLQVTWAVAGVAVLGLLPAAGVAEAGGRGPCASAMIDEPFQAPDGSLHAPGKLTICASRQYSPVSFLHSTYVDGMPVAMLVSRRGTSEAAPEAGRPFMMFHRDAGGLLHLAGYASPAGERMVTYRLDLARVETGRRVAGRGGSREPVVGAPMLILAARTD